MASYTKVFSLFLFGTRKVSPDDFQMTARQQSRTVRGDTRVQGGEHIPSRYPQVKAASFLKTPVPPPCKSFPNPPLTV